MTLADLYANIALENMIASAGDITCEQPTHSTEYPCTVEPFYLLNFSCLDQAAIKVCENIYREVLDYQRMRSICPCGLPIASCWNILPF